jgi:biofilm protein TabA
MILDSLSSASHYTSLHPHFAKAFEYLNNTNLAQLEDGKFDVDGDNIRAIVSNKNGVSAEESCAKFECHNKHIDIQVCINGNEQMGWKPRKHCVLPNGDYNDAKDVQLFLDKPDTFFDLQNNQFTIFFPSDVHAPMIGEGPIKKLVLKIKM